MTKGKLSLILFASLCVILIGTVNAFVDTLDENHIHAPLVIHGEPPPGLKVIDGGYGTVFCGDGNNLYRNVDWVLVEGNIVYVMESEPLNGRPSTGFTMGLIFALAITVTVVSGCSTVTTTIRRNQKQQSL